MGTLWLSIAVLVHAGQALEPAPDAPRRVYVLHSGVHILFAHPDKNHAALVLQGELRKRQVPARDIVVLDCPFPVASWKDWVPREGLTMFLDSMDAGSKVSYDAYRRLHQSLQAHGVGPKDEIVWIGHSAGGQVGLTMAQLSAELSKHAELANATRPYRFHTIVTLGTPVGSNMVPEGVRVIHYYSPQDKIVRIVCDLGPWIWPQMGYRRTIRPTRPAPGKDSLTRMWHDVEHPDWIYEPHILDRVWQDINGDGRSWWREPGATARPGAALAQLLGQMLEEEHRLCIEDLPR